MELVVGRHRADQSSGGGRAAAHRQLALLQLHLGQVSVVGQHPRCRGEDGERLANLLALLLDKVGAARQASDLGVQPVSLGGGGAPGCERLVEPRRR